MKKTPAEHRLAENEMVFKQSNEQVIKGLTALKQAAASEGEAGILGQDGDMPLYFYCECSDENCRQRIIMKPSKYEQLHQNSSQFVLVPGHEIPEIERVVFRNERFVVVEKFITPPQGPAKLNSTDIDKAKIRHIDGF